MSHSLTLLLGNSPHHQVHTSSIGLTAQFEWTQVTLQVLHVMKDPLQLRLAAVELLQDKVVDLLHVVCLQIWHSQELGVIISQVHVLCSSTHQVLYLSDCTVCLLAFWKWWRTEGHWMTCSENEDLDSAVNTNISISSHHWQYHRINMCLRCIPVRGLPACHLVILNMTRKQIVSPVRQKEHIISSC